MEITDMNWRKSSYSGNGGSSCIEVASDGAVMVRDTKDRTGPVLHLSPAAWRRFADQVKCSLAPGADDEGPGRSHPDRTEAFAYPGRTGDADGRIARAKIVTQSQGGPACFKRAFKLTHYQLLCRGGTALFRGSYLGVSLRNICSKLAGKSVLSNLQARFTLSSAESPVRAGITEIHSSGDKE
jgi:hypothetical protein